MANKTIAQLDSLTPSSTSLLAMYENGSTGNTTLQQILNTAININGSETSVVNAVGNLASTVSNLASTVSGLSDNNFLIPGDEDEEQTPSSEDLNFDSQDDNYTPSSSTSVNLLVKEDSWSLRFVKISQMFKNIRYLLGAVGALRNDLKFFRKTYSYNYTNLAAGAGLNITGSQFGITTEQNNYYPIAFLEARAYTAGTQVAIINLNAVAVTATMMSIKNTYTSAISGTAQVTILWVRKDLVETLA